MNQRIDYVALMRDLRDRWAYSMPGDRPLLDAAVLAIATLMRDLETLQKWSESQVREYRERAEELARELERLRHLERD